MHSPSAVPPLSSSSASAASSSSAAAAGSALDTLSPSISSKQRTALDQLCDFAITNKNTQDGAPVASTEGDAAKLLASLTPNPVPPDCASATTTTALPSTAVKTCVIQPKLPLPAPATHPTTTGLVRIYDGEERRTKIGRYLEKRKHKTWTRQVRYPSRQGSADSRNRVKGRFVSKKAQVTATASVA